MNKISICGVAVISNLTLWDGDGLSSPFLAANYGLSAPRFERPWFERPKVRAPLVSAPQGSSAPGFSAPHLGSSAPAGLIWCKFCCVSLGIDRDRTRFIC